MATFTSKIIPRRALSKTNELYAEIGVKNATGDHLLGAALTHAQRVLSISYNECDLIPVAGTVGYI